MKIMNNKHYNMYSYFLSFSFWSKHFSDLLLPNLFSLILTFYNVLSSFFQNPRRLILIFMVNKFPPLISDLWCHACNDIMTSRLTKGSRPDTGSN